jgi:hypothetical protein
MPGPPALPAPLFAIPDSRHDLAQGERRGPRCYARHGKIALGVKYIHVLETFAERSVACISKEPVI